MRYLAIDPGETTGVAYLDTSSRKCWMKSYDSNSDVLDVVNSMVLTVDQFIVETSPKFTDNNKQRMWHSALVTHIKFRTDRLILLSPGIWKSVAKARKWHHTEAKTQHEDDAYNFIRYMIWLVYRKDIGAVPCEK